MSAVFFADTINIFGKIWKGRAASILRVSQAGGGGCW
jgi:hypothetical protein